MPQGAGLNEHLSRGLVATPPTTTKTCTARPGRGNGEDNRSHGQAPLHMSIHLIPILQMRKVELREVEHLGQSHTALNLQD